MKTLSKNRANSKRVSKTALLLLVLVNLTLNLYSYEMDYEDLYSKKIMKSSVEGMLGVSVVMMPRAIVEEEIAQVPLLNLGMSYSLKEGLSVESKLMTNYLTNSLSVGVKKTKTWDNAYGSFTNMTEVWYGTARMSGFKANAYGLKIYPSVTLGTKMNDYKLEVKAEAMLNIKQTSKVDNTPFQKEHKLLTGVNMSLMLKHKVWRKNEVVLGVQMNYSEPSHLVWLAFSEVQKWSVYPQFTLGYSL